MDAPLLQLARGGDEGAFAELTSPFHRELHVHCYRMLGSVDDADELLQETLVAAWRGLGGFAGRSSLRSWLYQIATNRCLNAIRASKRRPPATPVPPFEPPEPTRRGEITWLQPYPDAWLDPGPEPSSRYEGNEAVRLAFVAALQRIPPRQTAAVVLCDVLDFPLGEVAGMLSSTPTAIKGLLQRGRASLAEQASSDDQPEPGSPEEAELANRFAAAYSADDVDAVVALLTDDVWLAMPPAPHEYLGVEATAGFLRASAAGRGGRRYRLTPTRANGQLAFGCRMGTADGPLGEPSGLIVLTLSGDRVSRITRFLDPTLTARFENVRDSDVRESPG